MRRPYSPTERASRHRQRDADGTLDGLSRVAQPVQSGGSLWQLIGSTPVGGSGTVAALAERSVEHVTIYRTTAQAAQSIPTGTATNLTWPMIAVEPNDQHGFLSQVPDADSLTIDKGGLLILSLRAAWLTFFGGGTFEVVRDRGGVESSWTLEEADGGNAGEWGWSGTVEAGDEVSIRVTQSSGSAQDMGSATLHASLVPMRAAIRQCSPVDPTTLPGLFLHLDASQETGLTDGQLLDTFTDQSGNGRDFTGAGTERPTYRTNQLNGLPGIEFDGSSDRMSDAVFFNAAGDVHTMFVVMKAEAAGPAMGVVDNAGVGSLDRGWVWAAQADGSHIYLHQDGAGGGGANEVDAQGAGVLGQPMVAHVQRTLSEVKAGTAGVTWEDTETLPGYTASGSANAWLGYSRTSGGTSRFDGFLYEVVVFDRVLTDAETCQVASFLADKWGL